MRLGFFHTDTMIGLPFPSSVELANASPADHPLRTAFFLLPILYFAVSSLQLLRRVNSGSTFIVHPHNLFSLRIFSGKNTVKSKKDLMISYNGPLSTAFLGLLFFAAAEFLLVSLFLSPLYTF